MKKITLFIFLLTISLGYSQSLPFNFSTANQLMAGDACATSLTTDAGDAVLQIIGGGTPFDNAQKVFSQFLNLSNDANNTITFRIKPVNGTGSGSHLLKFENGVGGPVNIELPFTTTGTAWQNITVNFGTGLGNYPKIVIFTDFNNPSVDTYLIDDIAGGTNVAPTCTDGLQNGDETGVDCGGTTCNTCIVNPTLSATSPTIPAANVLSVYSETYPAANTVTAFNFNAFQGSGTISEVDIESNNNKSGRIVGLQFYGAEWAAVNVSTYNFVHIDYYSTASTNFNFYLIDQTAGIPGGNPSEPRYSFGGATPNSPLILGSWQSVFIPLSHFDNFNSGTFSYDLNDIYQWKFDGNGTIYFDNIYFSTTNLGTDTFEASKIKMYPNPSSDVLTFENNDIIDSITIYNTLGQEVLKTATTKNIETISVANLQVGIYVVKINTAGTTSTQRFVKK